MANYFEEVENKIINYNIANTNVREVVSINFFRTNKYKNCMSVEITSKDGEDICEEFKYNYFGNVDGVLEDFEFFVNEIGCE